MRGFHEIRFWPEDVKKTAFKRKYGHVEFSFMPMGRGNAHATVQLLMNPTFCDDTYKILCICLDDVLVFSNLRENHIRRLSIVLNEHERNDFLLGRKTFELLAT